MSLYQQGKKRQGVNANVFRQERFAGSAKADEPVIR
jgi:hypothetical protein